MSLFSDLVAKANLIKNETVDEANSAERIGQMFIDLINFAAATSGIKKGMTIEWDLNLGPIPTGFVLADGYGGVKNNGVTVPDHRDSFAIGYNPAKYPLPLNATDLTENYGKIGNTGGKNWYRLTGAQSGLQEHEHEIPASTGTVDGTGSQQGIKPPGTKLKTSKVAAKDATEDHDNRPRYIVCCMITKVSDDYTAEYNSAWHSYLDTTTDDPKKTEAEWVAALKGTNGRGIVSNERISGNGAAGTTDTYRTTYTDGSTDTYTVTNGSGGGIDPDKLIEINRVIENDTAPILIVKDEVDAVENLSSSYPNAKFGWASRITATKLIYSFNGVEWKNTGRKLFESELNAIVGSSNSNINYNLIIAKKMFGLGDSFMEGEFFAELVAKNLKCLLVKDGIGGSCITGGMENSEGDGTTRISIVNRIDAALANNCEILLVQGGSNDWYYQAPLGTIDSTDVNTYYGALKYIAEKCASKLKKIVVVPINLMVRNTPKKSGGSAGRTNYSNQRQYADAFVEVFKMYGIQTCDIFSNLSITFENSSFYTIDGCHPNLAGKVRLSNYISQWIISNASVGLNQSQVITGEYVNWINLYKFTFSDNVLSSVSGGWLSSARGDQSFVSKSVFSGIQAKLNMPIQVAMDGIFVGFSDIEPSSVAFPRYNAIRYALYWTASICAVWENGIQQGNSTSLAGGDNSFAIQLRNGNVEYIINSVTVRTVPVVDGLVLFPVATSTNNPTIVNCDLTIN